MTEYAVSPFEHSMAADTGSEVLFQLRSSVEGSGQWDDATPQYWTIDDESVATIDQTSGIAPRWAQARPTSPPWSTPTRTTSPSPR